MKKQYYYYTDNTCKLYQTQKEWYNIPKGSYLTIEPIRPLNPKYPDEHYKVRVYYHMPFAIKDIEPTIFKEVTWDVSNFKLEYSCNKLEGYNRLLSLVKTIRTLLSPPQYCGGD